MCHMGLLKTRQSMSVTAPSQWYVLSKHDMPSHYSAKCFNLDYIIIYHVISLDFMNIHCVRFVLYHDRWDLLLIRVLIQNGIALYASWCTVATLVGLTIILVTISNMTEESACSFSLSILSLELIVFFIFDVTVFDRYTRYTFTTYPTFIWALAGILARNFSSDRPHMIFALSLLCITTIMFVVKLVVALRRRKADPLDYDMPEKRRLNVPAL